MSAPLTPSGKGRIGRQISLPLSQAFKISLRNITIRLGRAAITSAGTLLGIAFLMSVCTSSIALAADPTQEKPAAARYSGAPAWAFWAAPLKAMNSQPDDSLRARSVWLVSISLLVCAVGITNSMLMSVTERFREIGTMKCLGALDGFIVKLYLIESALIGFLSSVVGTLLGSGIMLITYLGKIDASRFDWGTLLGCAVCSILLGTVLSVLAAVWPAMHAARLPAASALRTEI